MKFNPPLQRATLIRRYKRFLADVETAAGATLTLHCPNTGAMTGCADPGSPAWYSTSTNARRKYPHTLEIVGDRDGHLIGINSARANTLVVEALADGVLPGFPAGARVRREVAIPGQRGRLDLLVDDVYVEVKSVTLKLSDSGAFPDAVSVRATRHLDTLARLMRAGQRTALVFCVQHTGIDKVRSADEIDPDYGDALRRAVAAGVHVLAVRCRVTPSEIAPVGVVPVYVRSAGEDRS
ncbi:MAG: DNA/RNA nuclease SfsA [Gammaproteobacteria bacterium]|nr:DNA/RNA nuclease SfsA [Gammaproteobacteria bacterium]MXY56901.1 DNA/RNA nuclease SfsA [Gammaproteobacteria bacterium]MYF29183.1 DNA/RNA nuclease SfsA [Gammaproteobacteria bacterium]MYK47968.1 DNA/RNA nuclease SfsA [Gammaproteobacteria bacterium]